MTHNRYVLVRYPDVRSLWTTTHDCWFQTVNYGGVDEEWIRLFLSPIGGWRMTNTYLDGEPELRHSSSSSALLTVSRHRQTFEGKVEGCHAAIFGMIKELADAAIASNDSDAYTPVTILDYASPANATDLRAAINGNVDVPVERSGLLQVSEVEGMIGNGSNLWLPGGFTFKFDELKLYV